MCSLNIKNNYQNFFAVELALKIFFYCPISNFSAERNFSVLKRLETYDQELLKKG